VQAASGIYRAGARRWKMTPSVLGGNRRKDVDCDSFSAECHSGCCVDLLRARDCAPRDRRARPTVVGCGDTPQNMEPPREPGGVRGWWVRDLTRGHLHLTHVKSGLARREIVAPRRNHPAPGGARRGGPDLPLRGPRGWVDVHVRPGADAQTPRDRNGRPSRGPELGPGRSSPILELRPLLPWHSVLPSPMAD